MKKIVNQIEIQDEEWANDWKIIVSIFEKIDELEKLFSNLDVSYLREMWLVITKLYGWSLQNYIVEKYSRA